MAQRPVIKDGNTLIFPNGDSRKMTVLERVRYKLGGLKTVPLSSGKPTKFI